MGNEWTQGKIQGLINDGVEESQELEYKGASALGKSDGKRSEISKDISSIANAAGGTIIYGVKEYDEEDKRHKPEILDPIDRTEFTREWLEQVINGNIRPRIDGITIHPVGLDSSKNDTAYVLEIPQSKTAHQAADYRYYRRYNFEVLPMPNDQVRDVMNRGVLADAEVVFDFKTTERSGDRHRYHLQILIHNLGPKVINNLKLSFSFPDLAEDIYFKPYPNYEVPLYGTLSYQEEHGVSVTATFRSSNALFPEDKIDLTDILLFQYTITNKSFRTMRGSSLSWTLFADDMPRKNGGVPFSQLNEF